MLTELSIRNFAIIDDISITFDEGLTVLTGETGAGKSIIIDAVQLLTGARASVDFIRHGEQKAEIIGLFDFPKNKHAILKQCELYDIDVDEDELFVLERTITNKGKSICRVNGKIVTLMILRTFGELFVQIHSQHDHVDLMDVRTHIQLLDAFDTKHIAPLKRVYEEKYHLYDTYRKKFNSLHNDEQQLAQRLDLLLFQQTEITDAALKKDEDVHLEEERKELQNYSTIFEALATAYEALYGDGKALEYVDIAKKAFEDPKLIGTPLEKFSSKIETIYYQLEEITFDIRNQQDGLYFDEGRLNSIESRLNQMSQLKRKYGETVNDVIKYGEKVKQEIHDIENREAQHEQLFIELEAAKKAAESAALTLSKARKKAAIRLTKEIHYELADLYLPNTVFDIAFQANEENTLHRDGIDDLQFMVATNKGEPLKPLHKIVSGGEISRMMLALKKIFAKHDKIGTVIFDEIDTGVSGRVAQAIAEKMHEITKTTQVLCITHLAQVAAMSDHHVLIEKLVKHNRTTTSISTLNKKEKTNEIAKMITGTELTKTATEHATQLLTAMNDYKKK